MSNAHFTQIVGREESIENQWQECAGDENEQERKRRFHTDSAPRSRRRGLHQPLLDRQFDSLHAAVYAELVEDIRDMKLDRA